MRTIADVFITLEELIDQFYSIEGRNYLTEIYSNIITRAAKSAGQTLNSTYTLRYDNYYTKIPFDVNAYDADNLVKAMSTYENRVSKLLSTIITSEVYELLQESDKAFVAISNVIPMHVINDYYNCGDIRIINVPEDLPVTLTVKHYTDTKVYRTFITFNNDQWIPYGYASRYSDCKNDRVNIENYIKTRPKIMDFYDIQE